MTEEFTNATTETTEDIITEIESILQSSNKQEIDIIINSIIKNIKLLIKETRINISLCCIARPICLIPILNHTVNKDICNDFYNVLNQEIDNQKLNTKQLQLLKKYLCYFKRKQNYSTVSWILIVSILISQLMKERDKFLRNNIDIYQLGIQGIYYLPAENSNIEEIEALQKIINENMEAMSQINSKIKQKTL